jgi:hypothetical protein
LFVSDNLWLSGVIVVMLVPGVCMLAYCLLSLLPAIESNNTECNEEGEVFEYQEKEDQGQANQGKPSIIDTYLILFTYFACFIKVY